MAAFPSVAWGQQHARLHRSLDTTSYANSGAQSYLLPRALKTCASSNAAKRAAADLVSSLEAAGCSVDEDGGLSRSDLAGTLATFEGSVLVWYDEDLLHPVAAAVFRPEEQGGSTGWSSWLLARHRATAECSCCWLR